MDSFIFFALLQDGVTTGAIYLLLAIGLLITFSVTRVIFVPQGDLLAFGALTAASLQSGHVPGTLWLLDGMSALALVASLRRAAWRAAIAWGVYPLVLTLAARLLAPLQQPAVSILLALAIVTPMGPLIWRFAFRPVADASVLALLIIAMALHFVLSGLGLVFFGPEEASAPALTDASFDLGQLNVSGQSICVLASCAILVAGLRWFFGATIHGKALRAAASDRLGARLVGIDAGASGALAFALAAFIAALAGVLIGAITPLSLRFRLRHRTEGLRRSDHGRTGFVPARRRRCGADRCAGIARQLLGQCVSRRYRLHAADSGSRLAFAARRLGRGARVIRSA